MSQVSELHNKPLGLAEDGGFLHLHGGPKLPNPAAILQAQVKRRYLVIVRIGGDSEFLKWFDADRPRSWDVALSFYKLPNQPLPASVDTIIVGGLAKYPAIKDVYAQDKKFFDGYDRLLLLDDDIILKFDDVDKLFAICEAKNLAIAQPALSESSSCYWPFLRHNRLTKLRYTNFIEVMMPIFSKQAFSNCVDSFDQSVSSFGLDFIWPAILEFPARGLAVIDEIVADHLRPMDMQNGAFYTYLRSIGINASAEMEAVLSRHKNVLRRDQIGVVDIELTPEAHSRLNWLPNHQGEKSTHIMKLLHAAMAPQTYIEIGGGRGDILALASCKSIVVDTAFDLQKNFHGHKPIFGLYQMTPEQYFATQNPITFFGQNIDFAVLSGVHLADALLKTFCNIEKYSTAHTVCAIFNAIPVDGIMALRSRADALAMATADHAGWWTGDAWLAVEALLKYRPDLKIQAFDMVPAGLIIITGLNPQSSVIEMRFKEIISGFVRDEDIKSRYHNYIKQLKIESTAHISGVKLTRNSMNAV